MKTSILLMVAMFIVSNPAWALHPALDALDKAKDAKEWEQASKQVQQVDQSVDSELRQYAQDQTKDGRKRVVALRAICGHMSTEACDQELENAFQDHDMMFHASVAMEMGRTKGDRTLALLKKSLADPNEQPFAQVAAAQSLAARGDASGKDRALQAVLHAEPWADFGMQTLATLKATDEIPILESTYRSSSDYHIKNDCRLAVLRIRLAGHPDAEQAQLLKAALEEDGFFEVRKWAGIKLGSLGGPASRQALIDVWNNKRSPGREDALKGLEWGIQQGQWTQEEVQ